jgi:hypothetical protein
MQVISASSLTLTLLLGALSNVLEKADKFQTMLISYNAVEEVMNYQQKKSGIYFAHYVCYEHLEGSCIDIIAFRNLTAPHCTRKYNFPRFLN